MLQDLPDAHDPGLLEGVRFVVVGGFAAVAHGSPLPTYDIDITPEGSRTNLEQLLLALHDLAARIRTEGDFAELDCAGVGRGPGWVPVQLASLDHLIRSKTAADRPTDRAALPLLQALRDRLEA